MRIPKLDTANGYGELVPQSPLHQLVARLAHLASWWLFLEASKTITRLAAEDFARAIGPAEKLMKISSPRERRIARAIAEGRVAGADDPGIPVDDDEGPQPKDGPQPDPRTVADANGPGRHLFVCGERFLGDYDVWRTCNRSPHADGEHDDFLPIDGQDRPRRVHPSDSPDAEQTLDDLPGVVSGLPYVNQLAVEVEPETTEA